VKPPEEQIDFLLSYEGRWPAPSTDGLAAAVANAATRNLEWAEKLLRAFAQRDAFQHPIWHRVFWQLEWKKIPTAFQFWIVDTISTKREKIKDFGGPTRLIFVGESFEPVPSLDLVEAMLDLSLSLWPILVTRPNNAETTDLEEDWTSRAINSAEGRIAEFWLRYVDHSRPDRVFHPEFGLPGSLRCSMK